MRGFCLPAILGIGCTSAGCVRVYVLIPAYSRAVAWEGGGQRVSLTATTFVACPVNAHCPELYRGALGPVA